MAEMVWLALLLAAFASPFVLMAGLIRARRRAARQVANLPDEDSFVRVAEPYEDVSRSEDGLVLAQQQAADRDLIPPDHSGGDVAGVRALQGRR